MSYDAELQFLQRILKQLSVPLQIIPAGLQTLPDLDMGLRAALGLGDRVQSDWAERMGGSLRERMLIFVTDEFDCHYAVVKLPEKETAQVLVIGPYMVDNVDQLWLERFMERGKLHEDWRPVLERFYLRVRRLENEHMLLAALQALAEHIWGAGQFSTERVKQGVPEAWMPLSKPSDRKTQDDVLDRIRVIEQRYEAENRLMELIRQGRGEKAQMMLSQFSRSALERRGEPVRDVKNYTVIMNTLMRKAAEQAGVHPSYIDRVSADFAKQIEQARDWESFLELWKEMARAYCLLVRKHTTKGVSPMVQKVISRIDFDLTGDLSLRATAKAFNVSPSYLSTLFKREIGETLTSYVNQRRMEHAAYLLSTSQMPVSSVALSCGISDDNYFTKLFKRCNGVTPLKFRRDQMRFPK